MGNTGKPVGEPYEEPEPLEIPEEEPATPEPERVPA